MEIRLRKSHQGIIAKSFLKEDNRQAYKSSLRTQVHRHLDFIHRQDERPSVFSGDFHFHKGGGILKTDAPD